MFKEDEVNKRPLYVNNMDPLMIELENLVLEKEYKTFYENSDEDEIITDWDMLTKMKKGADRTENHIFKRLENLNLEPKIKNTAIDYFNRTVKTPEFTKIKFKNAIMCASIFLAFSYHEDHREENYLLKHFSINKLKYTKGLQFVKMCVKEVRNIKKTPDNTIFFLCSVMNILDEISRIKLFITEHIDECSKNCPKSSVQMLSNSLFYIWLFTNKNTIPTINSFSGLCNVSFKSLKKVIYKNNHLMLSYVDQVVKEKFNDLTKSLKNIVIVDKIHINTLEISKKILKEEFSV